MAAEKGGNKSGNGGLHTLWALAGIAALLVLWELGALAFGSDLILPGPVPVLRRLGSLVTGRRFLSALGASFLRVLGGMAVSAPLGLACGIAAGLDRRIDALLRPLFSVIAATPVMSLILISFLILGAGRTPVFTAFLMVFPVMAANTIEGIRRVDPGLKELFAVYGMSRREALARLYFPSITPFILGGLRSGLSLCWKVIVASEVLVQPAVSLGAGMQQAKARLETPELFAWTVATVAAAAFTQGVLSLVIACNGKKRRRK
jgi:NitT/TauT family transport system permease protein